MVVSGVRSCLPVVAREPVLGILEPALDAGPVRQNEPAKVVMAVRNNGAGGKDLRVRTTVDCAWIKPPPDEIAIPAGEARDFIIEMAPDNSVESGDFAATLLVQGENAAIVKQAEVALTGRVVEDVALAATPESADFGEQSVSNEPTAVTIAFGRSDGQEARPWKVEFEAEGAFGYAVETASSDGSEMQVRVHTANRPRGSYEGTLIVADRDADVREVVVPVCIAIRDVARLRCEGEYELEADGLRGIVSVPLKNAGDVPLQVRAVTEVDWLRPEEASLSIAPAGKEELRLAYDLEHVTQSTLSATLYLHSNDNGCQGSLRPVRITLARLWPRLQAEVDLPGTVLAGRNVRFVIRLSNQGAGLARAVCGDLPESTSLDNHTVTVPANRAAEIKGAIRTSRTEIGPHTRTIPIDYNAPPGESGRLDIPVKFEAVRGRSLASYLRWLVVLGVIGGLAGGSASRG